MQNEPNFWAIFRQLLAARFEARVKLKRARVRACASPVPWPSPQVLIAGGGPSCGLYPTVPCPYPSGTEGTQESNQGYACGQLRSYGRDSLYVARSSLPQRHLVLPAARVLC